MTSDQILVFKSMCKEARGLYSQIFIVIILFLFADFFCVGTEKYIELVDKSWFLAGVLSKVASLFCLFYVRTNNLRSATLCNAGDFKKSRSLDKYNMELTIGSILFLAFGILHTTNFLGS